MAGERERERERGRGRERDCEGGRMEGERETERQRERERESVPVAMEIVCFVPLSKGCSVSVEVGVSGKWGRGCSVASSVL